MITSIRKTCFSIGVKNLIQRQFSGASDQIKSDIWKVLRKQAQEIQEREPLLVSMITESILKHDSFRDALIFRLSTKLGGRTIGVDTWSKALNEAFEQSKLDIEKLAMEDLVAVEERDPACTCIAQAFLYFKGYKSIQSYRFSHSLWENDRKDLAMVLQARNSELFGADIHPAAKIGGGLMLDHATGVVIGETAVIGEDCSLLHNVTLGGTGIAKFDRHPKIGNNVVIGCGASVLGNIKIGDGCKIGSGSMITKPLDPGCTVVGNPSRIINVDPKYQTLQGGDVPSPVQSTVLKPANLDLPRTRSISSISSSAQTHRPHSIKTWTKIWIPKKWENQTNKACMYS